MPSQPVTDQPRAGFFGKLPSNGDFLTRRLARGFTDPWDQWLQNAIADSREQLGDGWLESYLVSPMWRFALSPGLCGQRPWCGVLMPSVDRVGRYYPLTLAQGLSAETATLTLLLHADDWFTRVEDMALAALNEELDLSGLDEQLATLPPPSCGPRPKSRQGTGTRLAWAFALPPGGQRDPAQGAALGDLLLRRLCSAYSLWWTRDDEDGSSLLVCEGLPPVEQFAAMIDGSWSERGWAFWQMPGTSVTAETERST